MAEKQTIMTKVSEENAELMRSYMEEGKSYNEALELMEKAMNVDNTQEGDQEQLEAPKEEATYLLLYEGWDRDEGFEYKTFEEVIGKRKLYDTLKNLVPEGMDIFKSYIVNTNVNAPLDEFKLNSCVYEFMKYYGQVFQDDMFDIEDFNTGDTRDLEG